MTIDKSKEYKTRSGKFVRIYATDANGLMPVHGAFSADGKNWHPQDWTSDGKYSEGCETSLDLVEVKPKFKLTRYLNVYKDEYGEYATGGLYTDKNDVPRNLSAVAIATVIVEGFEDEGLEEIESSEKENN